MGYTTKPISDQKRDLFIREGWRLSEDDQFVLQQRLELDPPATFTSIARLLRKPVSTVSSTYTRSLGKLEKAARKFCVNRFK